MFQIELDFFVLIFEYILIINLEIFFVFLILNLINIEILSVQT